MSVSPAIRYFLVITVSFLSFKLNAQLEDINKIFETFEVLSLNANSQYDQVSLQRDHVHTLRIGRWVVELEVNEIIAPNYQLITSSGVTPRNTRRAIPMKGYTNDGGRAYITIADNFIYGFIEEGETVYHIEPLSRFDKNAKEDQFILYDRLAIRDNSFGSCGATFEKDYKPIESHERKATTRNGNCYEVEYAICHDFLMYQRFGNSITALENFAIGVTNDIQGNYDDEFADEIRFVITGQFVVTSSSSDPWTSSTNSSTFLGSFDAWREASLSIPHDIASCWTNRDFDGSTIGVAYLDAVCYGYKKSNVLQYTVNDAAWKLRVLTAHELGHNFGADHDGSGSGFIMAPSVNNTSTWSGTSINAIQNFYASVSCMSACTNAPGTINFTSSSSSYAEDLAISGYGGMCGDPYYDIQLTAEITNLFGGNVTANVNVTGGSAEEGMDFDLLTPSITFSGGNLSRPISIRIYDDQIEEIVENVTFTLTIASGTANLGSNTHIMSITNNEDVPYDGVNVVNQEYIQFGNAQWYAPYVFNSSTSDRRTRFILNPSILTSYGLSPGDIDQLGIYVYKKATSQSFRNVRVGITEVNEQYLQFNTPFYSTSEVFYGNVTTPNNDWVIFNFDTPYNWNGSSSLYIEFCFDNTSAIGVDSILMFDYPYGTGHGFEYFAQNGTSGCSIASGTLYGNNTLFPLLLFSKPGQGVDIEQMVNTSSDTYLRVGETAHFYSDQGNIIASIKNIGTQNIECLNVNIDNAGTGKRLINFNGIQITDKSFYVETTNDAYYEATFYFKSNELGSWNNGNNLHFVKSTVPFINANANNSLLLFEDAKNTDIGGSGNKSYQLVGKGTGYYALTDSYDSDLASRLDQSDIIFHQANNGVIIRNEAGSPFVITVSSGGGLVASPASASVMASTSDGDIYMGNASNSLIFRQSNGGYRQISVGNDGTILNSSIANLPATSIDFVSGSFNLAKTYSGIIMQSSSGQCWKVYVNGVGEIAAAAIVCP